MVRFLNINLYLIFAASFLSFRVAGFSFQGYIWVFALLYAIYTFANNRRNRMPLVYILPWAIYLVLHLLFNFSFLGLQSTIMMLSPIFIGIAVSGFDYSEITATDILGVFRKFTTVFIVFSFTFWILKFGRFGFMTNAALVMTANILAAVAISDFYTYYKVKDLVKFGLLLLIPVLAVTRMAIFMSLLLIPLSFIRIRPQVRILTILVSIFIGSAVFFSVPVQEKMFYTGEGTIKDLSWGNKNFRSSGRSMINDILLSDMKSFNRYIGKGPREDVKLLKRKLNFPAIETHNDYLSTRYNYGYLGLGLFIAYNLYYFWAIFRMHRKITDYDLHILTASILVTFVTFGGFLYSDNVIRYNIYFTNIHFTLMGMVFGIVGSQAEEINEYVYT